MRGKQIYVTFNGKFVTEKYQAFKTKRKKIERHWRQWLSRSARGSFFVEFCFRRSFSYLSSMHSLSVVLTCFLFSVLCYNSFMVVLIFYFFPSSRSLPIHTHTYSQLIYTTSYFILRLKVLRQYDSTEWKIIVKSRSEKSHLFAVKRTKKK